MATIWQANTSFGEVSPVYVFGVEAGEIVAVQTFYDPRRFLERLERKQAGDDPAGAER